MICFVIVILNKDHYYYVCVCVCCVGFVAFNTDLVAVLAAVIGPDLLVRLEQLLPDQVHLLLQLLQLSFVVVLR